jgi:hypothetical protein
MITYRFCRPVTFQQNPTPPYLCWCHYNPSCSFNCPLSSNILMNFLCFGDCWALWCVQIIVTDTHLPSQSLYLGVVYSFQTKNSDMNHLYYFSFVFAFLCFTNLLAIDNRFLTQGNEKHLGTLDAGYHLASFSNHGSFSNRLSSSIFRG